MGAVSGHFDALFDCFVISLARTPERLKAFSEYNSKSAINFQHFVAVAGDTISEADIGRILAPGAMPYSRNSFGNALSHLTLWRRCIGQTKNFMVLEDDAVVRHDTKARLSALLENFNEWDIIFLGYNTDVPLELNVAPGIFCGTRFSPPFPSVKQLSDFASSTNPVGLHRLYLALGTCGYVVSPKGAQVLMQTCFPLDNRLVQYGSVQYAFRAAGLDAVMATIYPTISAYACLAPLVMTPNDKGTSTVNP
jgi:glycosyl transferase family 25